MSPKQQRKQLEDKTKELPERSASAALGQKINFGGNNQNSVNKIKSEC